MHDDVDILDEVEVDVVKYDEHEIDETTDDNEVHSVDEDDDDGVVLDAIQHSHTDDDYDDVDIVVILAEKLFDMVHDEHDELVVQIYDEFADDEHHDAVHEHDVMQQHVEVDEVDDDQQELITVVLNDEIEHREYSLLDIQRIVHTVCLDDVCMNVEIIRSIVSHLAELYVCKNNIEKEDESLLFSLAF